MISIKNDFTRAKLKPVRTLSGVAPMAVMMKPHVCPGRCIYCPLEVGMPRSYLSDEPAAQRAKRLDFDPYEQVTMRLTQLTQNGHSTDKIELIIIGGTFSAYPTDYKIEFIKACFEACNGQRSESLEEAQLLNETAKRRVVALSVETRPDWVTDEEVKLIRRLGVTKIQLGVQALDDDIMRLTERGHTIEDVAKATLKLRNAGLKICYHLMPDLPGSNPEKDVEMARQVFTDPRFKPDYVKIYPCMVVPYTKLKLMWERGEYQTYDDETLKNVLKEISCLVPEWCRVDRLVRDITKKWVLNGTIRTNMRQLVEQELIKEGRPCRCIRCREVKERVHEVKPVLKKTEIGTLGGKEVFLSFEKNDKLFAILRLRLMDKNEKILFDELKDTAIIREVHTYGTVVDLGVKTEQSQHRGLGRSLMEKAEEVALKAGFRKIAVISAIGTREYYRKLGYRQEGLYMIRDLS